MSRRTRAFSIGIAIAATVLSAFLLGSRGLRVVITNTTAAPLTDVELNHGRETLRIPRIDPDSSVTVRVRGPIAGAIGRNGILPLTVAFSQRGDRAFPVRFHCKTASIGWSQLDLSASESPVHRAVSLHAGMTSRRDVSLQTLVQNAVDPRVGPRRFVRQTYVWTDRTVIPRHNWASEASTAVAVALALRDEPILGTLRFMDFLGDAFSALLSAHADAPPAGSLPDGPLILPIPPHEATRGLRGGLTQLPLWP